jgi:predicted transcriptional regulator
VGRLPTENRKYQLQALNNIHHEVLRYALLGYKSRQIANMLGVTEPTVCNALNSAKGRQQMSIMRGARDTNSIDIAKDLVEFAPRCVEVLKELVDGEEQPMHLRAKYAIEMLGIAGHVKPQRVQVQGSVAHLTADEILAIKNQARQLAVTSGIVDIEYCEVSAEPTQGELSCGTSSSLVRDEAESSALKSSDNHS